MNSLILQWREYKVWWEATRVKKTSVNSHEISLLIEIHCRFWILRSTHVINIKPANFDQKEGSAQSQERAMRKARYTARNQLTISSTWASQNMMACEVKSSWLNRRKNGSYSLSHVSWSPSLTCLCKTQSVISAMGTDLLEGVGSVLDEAID